MSVNRHAVFQLAVVLLFVLRVATSAEAEDGGVMPRLLFDLAAPEAKRQVAASEGAQVEVGADGLALSLAVGPTPYPGVTITPADGKPWVLTTYGHIEANVTNTGSAPATINLRIDDNGPGDKAWNAESLLIGAGDTRKLRVYFGYSYGLRPGHPLKSEAVTRVLFFTGAVKSAQSFRISGLTAGGTPDESVKVINELPRRVPADGQLLAARDQFDPAVRGAVVLVPGELAATFNAGGGALVLKPLKSLWDLGTAMQVSVRLRNSGAQPAEPRVRLTSDDGSATVWVSGTIAPGAEGTVVIPFAPTVPWTGVTDPVQADAKAKGRKWSNQPETGTSFRSHRTAALEIELAGPGTVSVLAATASAPVAVLPEWLGKRPPVEGSWTQTLSEEFTGDHIDAQRWNVHGYNWYDKRQHFAKDEVIVSDGTLKLRAEKRSGFHNDDPAEKQTDYAVGWADTYGKWTQRYGYYETRAKLPTNPCLWPGVWMMPDRGLKNFPTSNPKSDWAAFKARGTQDGSGMELDIIEGQSVWGPHRFNIAMHWDGYGEHHKVIGTSANYVPTDPDGFIVIGMLWTPGQLVMYGNGQEIWRWSSPRIPDTQQFFLLQNLLGGWETEALDDSKLPGDFVLDYIRVWQRADLASPEDGAKKNSGGLDAFGEKP